MACRSCEEFVQRLRAVDGGARLEQLEQVFACEQPASVNSQESEAMVNRAVQGRTGPSAVAFLPGLYCRRRR